MPNGAAIMTATAVIMKVPTIVEDMPPERPMLRGISVRNAKLSSGRPFARMYMIMNIRIAITMIAAAQMMILAILSPTCDFLIYVHFFRVINCAPAFRSIMTTKSTMPVANSA